VAQGTKRAIYFACDARASFPAEEYLKGLNPNDQGKFFSKMNKFKDHDMQERREYDALTDGLWELIVFGSRWVGFYTPGRRAFLTHGFEKRRSGRTPPAEINRATAIRDHVLRSIAQ
jgi:hypothetical protein